MDHIKKFIDNIHEDNYKIIFDNVENIVYHLPEKELQNLFFVIDSVFSCREQYQDTSTQIMTLPSSCQAIIYALNHIIYEIIYNRNPKYDYVQNHELLIKFLFFWLYISYLRKNYSSDMSKFQNIKNSIINQRNSNKILLFPLKIEEDNKTNYIKISTYSNNIDNSKSFLMHENKDKLHTNLFVILRRIIDKTKTDIYGEKMQDRDIKYYEKIKGEFEKTIKNIEEKKSERSTIHIKLINCNRTKPQELKSFMESQLGGRYLHQDLNKNLSGEYIGGPFSIIKTLEGSANYRSIKKDILENDDSLKSKIIPIKGIFQGLKRMIRNFQDTYTSYNLEESMNEYSLFAQICDSDSGNPQRVISDTLQINQIQNGGLIGQIMPMSMINIFMQLIVGGISAQDLNRTIGRMGISSNFTPDDIERLKRENLEKGGEITKLLNEKSEMANAAESEIARLKGELTTLSVELKDAELAAERGVRLELGYQRLSGDLEEAEVAVESGVRLHSEYEKIQAEYKDVQRRLVNAESLVNYVPPIVSNPSTVKFFMKGSWDGGACNPHMDYFNSENACILLYDMDNSIISFCYMNFKSQLYFHPSMQIHQIYKEMVNDIIYLDFRSSYNRLTLIEHDNEIYLLNDYTHANNNISDLKSKSEIIQLINQDNIDIFIRFPIELI